MNDVFLRYVDLPVFVKGQVLMDENGDYNIYVNAKMPVDIQQETIKHEVEHINNGDFYNGRSIAEVESLAYCN